MTIPQLRLMLARNDKYVNNCNAWTLVHHRGNMDLQLLCNKFGAAAYACCYSSKAEAPDKKMLSNKVLQMLANEQNNGIHNITRKKLFLAAQAVYAAREVGMQEIAWYLLGYKFVNKTRKVEDVNLFAEQEKLKILKSKYDLSLLDSNSTDIFLPTKGYPESLFDWRSMKFEEQECTAIKSNRQHFLNISYYEFLSWYRKSEVKLTYKQLNKRGITFLLTKPVFQTILYVKIKKAKIMNIIPYSNVDFKDAQSARLLLILHHRRFKDWKHIDRCLKEDGSNLETFAVEILGRKIVEEKNLCPSFEMHYNKSTHLQRTLASNRNEAKENSESQTEVDEDDIYIDALHDPLHADFDEYLDDDQDFTDGNTHQSRNVFCVTNEKFSQALNYVKKLKEDSKKHRLIELQLNQMINANNDETMDARQVQELQKMLDDMSTEQKEAFYVSAAHLTGDDCTKSESNPTGQLRLHLAGAGGTGKSKVLKAIILYSRLIFRYDNTNFGPVLVVAPTGISAFNIQGIFSEF